MRRKATLAITLAAAMAATAVPAMADDKVSITIFNSKMEIQMERQFLLVRFQIPGWQHRAVQWHV